MIPLKLWTAFRTGASIRLNCLTFCFIDLKSAFCKQLPQSHTGLETYYCFVLFQVYIIGGDGTQKGASVIYEVMQFKVAMAPICSFFKTPEIIFITPVLRVRNYCRP